MPVHVLVLATALLILLSLSACGVSSTPTGNTHATATAGAAATGIAVAQATRVATPVLLSAQAHQEGSIAGNDLRLVLMISATNQTDATIHLAQYRCWDYVPPPKIGTIMPFSLYLLNATDDAVFASGIPGGSCMKEPPNHIDLREVAAGATYSTTATYQLSGAQGYDLRPLMLQAGTPYTIEIQLHLWYQGALDKNGDPDPGAPQGGADARIPITFH